MVTINSNNAEKAAERLLSDHLFDPTNKVQWINRLVVEGFQEEEAKSAFKMAAPKYHASRLKLRIEKSSPGSKFGKIAAYTGAAFFTFVVGKWIYIILVLLFINVLGFIFNI